MLKHKKIILTTSNFIKLYFARILGCLFPFPSKTFDKRDKLLKLYEIAEDKINREMNMVKLIKGLRNIRLFDWPPTRDRSTHAIPQMYHL